MTNFGDYTIDDLGNGKHRLSIRTPNGWEDTIGVYEAVLAKKEEYDRLLKQSMYKSEQLSVPAYLELIADKMEALKDTIKRKNADYTAGSASPFANFEVTEALGLSDAKTGVLIRMVDKIQRIKSYIKKGKLEVKNEGVDDAVMDIMGYSLILIGMLENDRRKGATDNGSV